MRWITLPEALDYVGGDKYRLQDAFTAGDVKTRKRNEDGTVQDLDPKKWRRGVEVDWQGSRLAVAKRDYVASWDNSPPRFVPVEVDLGTLLECFPAESAAREPLAHAVPTPPCAEVPVAKPPAAEPVDSRTYNSTRIKRKGGLSAPWTKHLSNYLKFRRRNGDDISSRSLAEIRIDFLGHVTLKGIRGVPRSRSWLDEQIKKAREQVLAEEQTQRDAQLARE